MSNRMRFGIGVGVVALIAAGYSVRQLAAQHEHGPMGMGGTSQAAPSATPAKGQQAVAAAVQDFEYYCTMHPNIVKSEPGKCPICGMSLVKRAKAQAAQPEEKAVSSAADRLSAAIQAIDAAKLAIKAGDQKTALAELDKAQSAIAAAQASAPAGPAKFANVRCPIMGSAIDPAKVPDSLTRDYKGQKIAFCCGGCPAAWGKLTPEQKDARLKAATDSK